MSSKDGILHCVLKKQWFEKIKSGEKKHEYREVKDFWCRRIYNVGVELYNYLYTCNPKVNKVKFTLGMTKEPDKVMLFKIKSITIIDGKNTDLAIDKLVYDIELGERIK